MNLNTILDFDGGGSCPVQYFVDYEEHEYYIRYRHGWLTIESGDNEVFSQRIAGAHDGRWSDKQTTAYLYLISDAIRNNSIQDLVVPTIENTPNHPMFVLGPLPRSHIIQCGQQHEHSPDCYSKDTYSPVEIHNQQIGG